MYGLERGIMYGGRCCLQYNIWIRQASSCFIVIGVLGPGGGGIISPTQLGKFTFYVSSSISCIKTRVTDPDGVDPDPT